MQMQIQTCGHQSYMPSPPASVRKHTQIIINNIQIHGHTDRRPYNACLYKYTPIQIHEDTQLHIPYKYTQTHSYYYKAYERILRKIPNKLRMVRNQKRTKINKTRRILITISYPSQLWLSFMGVKGGNLPLRVPMPDVGIKPVKADSFQSSTY